MASIVDPNDLVGRKQSYTVQERALVVDLVKKYRLEKKRAEALSLAMKKFRWDLLTEEYNAQAIFSKRNVKQLKKCWENIKAKAKKDLTTGKKGPNTENISDQSMFSYGMLRLENSLDSDAQFNEDGNESDSDCQEILPATSEYIPLPVEPLPAEPSPSPENSSRATSCAVSTSSVPLQWPEFSEPDEKVVHSDRPLPGPLSQAGDHHVRSNSTNETSPPETEVSTSTSQTSVKMEQERVIHELRVKELTDRIRFQAEEHVLKRTESELKIKRYRLKCDLLETLLRKDL